MASQKNRANINRLKREQKQSKKSSSGSSTPPQFIECPNCTGQVLTKKEGKIFSSVSGFLQRSFNLKIPTGLLSFLKENTPVSKEKIFKDKCAVCDGTKKIPNPSYKTYTAAQQVAKNMESRAEEVAELENRLAPACGNRFTIIQGCDLLEVGLGMNDFPSHRVDKDKDFRLKGGIDPSKINAKEGGPQIPEGGKCNHVEGLNPLSTPGGHYMIKCSNKFSLVVGSKGIDINTSGPITLNGAIMRFTGAETTIGSQTGKCTVQGDVVSVGGRSIEMAPTDGQVVIKGTQFTTGNAIVGGHNHSESVSFVNGECCARNETTKLGADMNVAGGPAFYGGAGVEGQALVAKDSVAYALKLANATEAQNVATKRYAKGLEDKMLNMAYMIKPIETKPTGFIIPGTSIILTGSVPCNRGGRAGGIIQGVTTAPIPLHNFPHAHAEQDHSHPHDIRMPAFTLHDSAESLRGAQGGLSSPAPLHKSQGGKTILKEGYETLAGLVVAVKGSKFLEGTFRKV